MAWKTLKKVLNSNAAEQLTTDTTLKCRQAHIQAHIGNSGTATIGDSNVAADRGIALVGQEEGDQRPVVLLLNSLAGNDIVLSQIYAIGTKNDIVCVFYDEY
jgi:hypothetical protein